MTQSELKPFQPEFGSADRIRWAYVGLISILPVPEQIALVRKRLPVFEGNVPRAAQLLAKMEETISWVEKKSSPPQPKPWRPQLVVYTHWDPTYHFSALARPEENVVGYREDKLEILSRFEPDEALVLTADDGQIAFIGTPKQIAALTTVEETRHIFFAKHIHMPTDYQDIPLSASLAKKDSHPIEIDGLQWQILYAKENNYPPATIQVLETRLKKALAI
jgi:hypothetical protein